MRSNKNKLNIAKVLVFRTGGRLFDYIANDMAVNGSIVKIPFGKKITHGLLVQLMPSTHLNKSQLKEIIEILPSPFCLTDKQIQLSQWMARYYHDDVYVYQAMMLPKWIKQAKLQPYVPQDKYAIKDIDRRKLSKIQQACVNWMHGCQIDFVTHEALIAEGFGEATIKSLIRLGILEISKSDKRNEFELSNIQKAAVDSILSTPLCSVLHGVTGSGKTYVYLALIQSVLNSGGQILVLVPEIGLTPQITAKLREYLSTISVYWHSQLSDGQKSSIWGAVYNSEIKVVIGTRSAMFLPFKNLKMIIVDEEHDMSFNQQNRPYFSVRDLSVLLAKEQGIKTILGSATPALETYNNVIQGKYHYVSLDQAFSGNKANWHIIDARKQHLTAGIANEIIQRVATSLGAGNQVLFFLNRRGYAPITLCHSCGWVYVCEHCDVKLTFSKKDQKYRCHMCQKQYPELDHCQSCASDALIKVGQGTEKLADNLETLFPNYQVLRVDADTTSSTSQWARVRQTILSGKPMVIVGTQMLAKGHHFPSLSDVIVLDADHALYATDFRSIERWGQRLKQVAGRCGRGDKPGSVWVQTHLPHHPAFTKLESNDYELFAEYLLQMRNDAKWPPNYFLAKIKLVASSISVLEKELGKILAQSFDHIEMIGPIFPSIQKRQNLYHGYVLIKANKRGDLANACRHLAQQAHRIEMDPQDLEA